MTSYTYIVREEINLSDCENLLNYTGNFLLAILRIT